MLAELAAGRTPDGPFDSPRDPGSITFMGTFRQLDFFDLDQELSEEERMVRDSVRSWVTERYLPIAMEHFENGTFPLELTQELGELGLFGPTVPEKYGGAGMNSVAYGLICQELERGDSGLRSFVSVQGSLVMWPDLRVRQRGAEARVAAAPRDRRGDRLLRPDRARLRLEPRRDARRPRGATATTGSSTAARCGSPTAPCSQVAVVWARTEDGIRGFLVADRTSPGFSAPEQKHKFSLRASITSELVLDDVRVPDRRCACPEPKGLKAPLGCLTQARYGIAWGGLGAALACFDEALQYAKERDRLRQAPGGLPAARRRSSPTWRPTSRSASSWPCASGGSRTRARITPAPGLDGQAQQRARRPSRSRASCRDMLGANGISLEYQVGRHLCNLESVITYEGTHDIHTLAIGHALTGQPAYR